MANSEDAILPTKNISLLYEVVVQIKKDFDAFGFDVKFTGNQETAWKELSTQLIPIVESLLSTNYQRLYNLLYKIDVSELQLASYSKANIDKPLAEVISDLILKRELQKVVLRKIYNNPNNSP
jgi:hypothetical protein